MGDRRIYDAARRADDQAVIGYDLALGNQRAGADQTVLADGRAVENDGLNTDQAVGIDRTAVQHRLVANRDTRPDIQRIAGIGMRGSRQFCLGWWWRRGE